MDESVKLSQTNGKLTPGPSPMEQEEGGCDEEYTTMRKQSAKTTAAGVFAAAATVIPGAGEIASGYFLANVIDLAYDEAVYDYCLLNSIFA